MRRNKRFVTCIFDTYKTKLYYIEYMQYTFHIMYIMYIYIAVLWICGHVSLIAAAAVLKQNTFA